MRIEKRKDTRQSKNDPPSNGNWEAQGNKPVKKRAAEQWELKSARKQNNQKTGCRAMGIEERKETKQSKKGGRPAMRIEKRKETRQSKKRAAEQWELKRTRKQTF